MTTNSSPTFAELAQTPYRLLQSGTALGSVPYAVCSRLYHTYRAFVRRDSSYLFCAERAVEIRWVFERLKAFPRGRLLELGDVLGPSLSQTGFEVETVDLHPRAGSQLRGWKSLAMDVRQLNTPDRFDCAVSISTFEHIGMGHYGDVQNSHGDYDAMDAVQRVLRPRGRILVTLPMGRPEVQTWQRLYSMDRISKLFSKFTVKRIQVYHFRWVAWLESSAQSSKPPKTFGPRPPDVLSIALVEAESPS